VVHGIFYNSYGNISVWNRYEPYCYRTGLAAIALSEDDAFVIFEI